MTRALRPRDVPAATRIAQPKRPHYCRAGPVVRWVRDPSDGSMVEVPVAPASKPQGRRKKAVP